MRRILIVGLAVVLALAGWWWVTWSPTPPIPGPPVSAPIANTAPVASADVRGLPTLAPTLRRVVTVDGRPVVSAAQLRARIGLVRVGETIELELLRNGNRLRVSARVAEAAQ
jgi:S1-C subfamily serine protease